MQRLFCIVHEVLLLLLLLLLLFKKMQCMGIVYRDVREAILPKQSPFLIDTSSMATSLSKEDPTIPSNVICGEGKVSFYY